MGLIEDGEYWKYITGIIIFGSFSIFSSIGVILRYPRLHIYPNEIVYHSLPGIKQTVCLSTYGKARPHFTAYRFQKIPVICFLENKRCQAMDKMGKKVQLTNCDKQLRVESLIPPKELDQLVSEIEKIRRKTINPEIDTETATELCRKIKIRGQKIENMLAGSYIITMHLMIVVFAVYLILR